jgi:hypothetical protein
MSINAFPLFWRWTQPSHSVLPSDVLEMLRPLSRDLAESLSASAPKAFGPSAVMHRATGTDDETRVWLASLPLPANRVSVVWSANAALSMPWEIFVTYWSDFCYPSSDDVDVFVEGGPIVLRWHHDEIFEYDGNAL